jgi:hypothetical protein
MNRRQFFGMTVAAIAAANLPAFVLPERTIFLPPVGGWWPGRNSLLTVEMITREALRVLNNQLVFDVALTNREYAAAFAPLKFTPQDLALSLDEFSDRIILPALYA